MTKRQEAALETRKRLLEAGQKLIAEKGFEAVSVEDITRECGVAKGTFYTHFQKKEEIVPELNRIPFQHIIEEVLALEYADIYEKITYYMLHFMECVETHGIQICRQWTCREIDPGQSVSLKDVTKLEYDIASLEELLKIWVRDHELSEDTPVTTLAHLIISELYGMMLCWCMSDGQFEPKAWVEPFCAVQLRGLLEPFRPLSETIQ